MDTKTLAAQVATERVQRTEALKIPAARSAFPAATRFAFPLAGLPGSSCAGKRLRRQPTG